MKIVCDACQAKYSISDDKVQGKVFKIRCKKCSNIIVVRGGAQASEAPAPAQEKDTRVYDYGYDGAGGAPADDAVWHLVINQDQVGPMTAAEVQQRFAAGEVDGETFAWREGFADWLPLAQVDAFAALVASGSTTAALPGPGGGGGGAAAVASMFGGGDDGGTMRSDAGDLFASASGGASHQHDDDGDLFGSKPSKSAGGGAGAGASQQKLRGERNENSVLFSLNNLAQLASDKPAPAAAAAPAGHATGAAGGEGSGLIDIRSMASAYLGGSGAAVGGAKPAAAGVGSIDDLPVFGGGGFSEPAVIVPTARASSNNKILYIMIGAVGLLAITAVIMVVMLLKHNKNTTTTSVAAADKGSAAASDKADSDKGSDKADKPAEASGSAEASAPAAGSDKPAEGSATQVATADKTEAPAPAPAPAEHETHSAPAHHEAHHESHHVASAAPAPAPAPKADSGGGGCDEVSCVLNNYEGACCQKFRKGGHGGGAAHASSGNSDLPEELTREMISSAIAAVKGRATACGDRSSAKGLVKVHVRVGGDGRVSSVSVSQTPDPSLGSCVAAAVQRASFPKTQRGGSFSYPFPF